MRSTTTTIAALAVAAIVLVGCSSTNHSNGSGIGSVATVAGGGTAAGGTGAGPTGSPVGTSSSHSTVAGGGSAAPNWLKAHATDLRALHSAVQNVDAAFQANDDTAKKAALIECANAAAPLARDAGGSLPVPQAEAFTTISDSCAAMTHDLKSGDTVAVATGKVAFDKAVIVVTTLFP
jgi:hypothetical protein